MSLPKECVILAVEVFIECHNGKTDEIIYKTGQDSDVEAFIEVWMRRGPQASFPCAKDDVSYIIRYFLDSQ